MDRETIAFVLIVLLVVALVAAVAFGFHNLPERKYKRRLKRDYAVRRENRTKSGTD